MENNTLPVDRIICGNNVEVLAGWEDECIDLTVTSPPYDPVEQDENGNLITHSDKGLRNYQGYSWDFTAVAQQLYRVTKQGGVCVWVVNDATINGSETGSSFRQALYFMGLGFRLHDTMIYANKKPPLSHNRYEQEFEYMFVFSKGGPGSVNLIRVPSTYFGIDKRKGGEYTHHNGYVEDKRIRNGAKRSSPKPTKIKGNVWTYKTGAGHSGDAMAFEHPATFPEKLAMDHILSWSDPGDLILDPFSGAGTVAKAATITGRHFIGIDISETYCRLAERRVSAVQQQPRLFAWDMSPATPDGRP